ncbi:MAG: PqqD family protein [Methanobacterium sp.]|nr:PqqD family protein [Methanobacterium sp.]
MGELSGSSMISVTKEAVHCDVEDEVVILSMKDGVYYGLNPVGAFIWNQIQKPKRVDEICDLIMGEFDVGREECEADLMDLLSELLDKGLIEVSDE